MAAQQDLFDEKNEEEDPLRAKLNTLPQIPCPFVALDQISPLVTELPSDFSHLLEDYGSAVMNLPQIIDLVGGRDDEAHNMIGRWARFPVEKASSLPETVFDVDSIETIQQMLQAAIQLEWATLPLYLSAMYSLQSSPGGDYAHNKIFKPIVLEEMKHFGLACNLLNAVGGTPNISGATAPRYPSKLPGGCLPNLTVDLGTGSAKRDRIRDYFMAVEQPQDTAGWGMHYTVSPVTDRKFKVTYDKTEPLIKDTIGKFYLSILAALDKNTQWIQPKRNQYLGHVGIFEVNDIADARKAIHTIVVEGEGTTSSPYELGTSLAHYFKFLSLYQNQLITKMTMTTRTDTSLVFEFETDGNSLNYSDADSKDSTEEQMADFTRTYTQMANHLNSAFSSPDPTGGVNAAVNDMVALPGLFNPVAGKRAEWTVE